MDEVVKQALDKYKSTTYMCKEVFELSSTWNQKEYDDISCVLSAHMRE